MTIPRSDPLSAGLSQPSRLPARGIEPEKLKGRDVTAHVTQHKKGGTDPLAAADIEAADAGHSHGGNMREVFLDVRQVGDARDILDDWGHDTASSTQTHTFVWHVPDNWTATGSLNVVMIPDATETIDADIDVSVAAVGEDYNADTRQSLGETFAVTVNDLTEWNILNIGALFNDIAAGDYVAVRFVSNTSTLRILGLRVVFTVTE